MAVSRWGWRVAVAAAILTYFEIVAIWAVGH